MPVVDTAVVVQEPLLRHFHLDPRIVGVSVKQYHGEGEHVADIGALEDLREGGVAEKVALRKLLHQAVDLLGLPREAEVRQEAPDGVIKLVASKVHGVHVGMHHLEVEVLALAKVITNHGLVEAARLAEEHRDVLRGVAQHVCRLQVGDALLRLLVEQRHALHEAQLVGLLALQELPLPSAFLHHRVPLGAALPVAGLRKVAGAARSPNFRGFGGSFGGLDSLILRLRRPMLVPLHERSQDSNEALSGHGLEQCLVLNQLLGVVRRQAMALSDSHEA
mmetsp:Transcript_1413/g.4076  ORF Transcript_1413/g.4076 Transcript_1413/m.4076 type:complete len:277 (+) Transcript_1413:2600-3430(+)